MIEGKKRKGRDAKERERGEKKGGGRERESYQI